MRHLFIAMLACMALFFQWIATAQAAPSSAQTPEVSVRLISKTENYHPEAPLALGVDFQLQPGWHIYANPPGDAGLPTEVTWTASAQTKFAPLQYPEHETFNEQGLTTFGYANTAFFSVDAVPGQNPTTLNISAKVSWLACKDVCIPGAANLSLALPLSSTPQTTLSANALFFPTDAASPQSTTPSAADQPQLTLWLALGFALLGGLILNLMPCVFPVLALKVFQFTEMSTKGQKIVRLHSLIYVAGALTGFAIIGGLLALLTTTGSSLGWGYQLQSPAVVLILMLIMLMVGLNLAEAMPQIGVFTTWISRIPLKSSPFLTGLLAVVVASPCTAPFMGGALGYAALQRPEIGFLIIFGVGIGFALPFTLLAWFPSLIAFLPKPGAWMLTLKKLLSIPMFGAALWLFWVLRQQINPQALYVVIGLLVMIGLSCVTKLKRHTLAVIALTTLTTIWFVQNNPRIQAKHTQYPAYSTQNLADALSTGKPVLVDFTAAWCITCAVNERSTLYTAQTKEFFKEHGIQRLTGDWTRQDTNISNALKALGRNGVPVYAFYPTQNAEPILLPELLTSSILRDTILQNLPRR